MEIGIPKEVKIAEQRVALSPEACRSLVQAGHSVTVERGAGNGAGFGDKSYQDAGATVVATAFALYERARLIVKVKEPAEREWPLLMPHHILFSYLHLAAQPRLVETLVRIGLTAVAFETVEENGKTPLLAPMSAIAGRLSVQLGSYYLHRSHGGRGVLLGGTRDRAAGHVTVLGIGVAGMEAVALAHGMGARVSAVDIEEKRLARAKALWPEIHSYPFSPKLLDTLLPETDLLVGAAYQPGKQAPRLVSESQIKRMPQGAVVIDIAIDQGGCIATSRPCSYEDPIYLCHGVIHSAITNLPTAVPKTASLALSRAILPYVLLLANATPNDALRKGINIANHELKISF